MKKLTQTLFFFLLVTHINFAQWYLQNSGTLYDLQDITFTDLNNGIAVGWIGTILKTSDGGINWISQYSGTEWLSAVSFVDVNNGLAVGYDQVNYKSAILRTTDGGNNWVQVSIGTDNYLHAVSFIDTNTAIAVGDYGLIIKTTNSGFTWVTQTSGTTVHLHGVSFFNSNIGTVIGGIFNISLACYEGIILRTMDGGNNWVIVYSDTTSDLLDVHLLDINDIVVVGGGDFRGQGIILKSTDGGSNWIKQYSSEGFEGISFADANTGTIVGGKYGNESIILRTTNAGNDWIEQSSGTINYLRGVSFSDDLNGWVVGDDGTILHTTNGGVSFVDEEQIDAIPTEFSLSNNFPNPFNPSTKIKYSIPQSSKVVIKVFDILGNEIETLVNEDKPGGTYEVTWYAENLPSGVYFYQLKAGTYVQTRKMLLLK